MLFGPAEIDPDPAITLFGICWLYSLPCLASLASLFCRNAQFLPMIVWGASIYNVWQYDVPELFVMIPTAMTMLHAALWVHEDYYVPITHANIFLGMEKKSIKYQLCTSWRWGCYDDYKMPG